jgi:hypothetical protein
VSVRRIDQAMAAAAAAILPPQVTPDLRTRYRQLRVMLHTAGLAATYAFVAAKANGETGQLAAAYADAAKGIRSRLAALGLLSGDPAQMSPRDVLGQLGQMGGGEYARASAEATALVGWLSRLADAVVQKPGSEAPTPGGPGR